MNRHQNNTICVLYEFDKDNKGVVVSTSFNVWYSLKREWMVKGWLVSQWHNHTDEYFCKGIIHFLVRTQNIPKKNIPPK